MRITQTPSFSRGVKKLHANHKKSLDRAIRQIASAPESGQAKVGDLAGIFIYKFKIANLEWLLAYRMISQDHINLLVFGPHENFYRDLKKTK